MVGKVSHLIVGKVSHLMVGKVSSHSVESGVTFSRKWLILMEGGVGFKQEGESTEENVKGD